MIDWRANEERKRVFKVHSQYNWIKRRWWWTEKKNDLKTKARASSPVTSWWGQLRRVGPGLRPAAHLTRHVFMILTKMAASRRCNGWRAKRMSGSLPPRQNYTHYTAPSTCRLALLFSYFIICDSFSIIFFSFFPFHSCCFNLFLWNSLSINGMKLKVGLF